MKLLPDSPLFPTGPEHYKDWAGLNAGSMAAVLAELARSELARAQALADRNVVSVETSTRPAARPRPANTRSLRPAH